ncbi:MAG: AMP-binding protein, partial [Rhodospirillales bacterium]|nr:AMP-binding protein [Rhodospirillales bacterium]
MAESEGWAEARTWLDGLPGGALNMAHEAVDRHLAAGRGGAVALRWLGRDGRRLDLTYAALSEAGSRFAGALAGLGLGRGVVVATLLGRVPALTFAALGTLKAGGIFCPLFAAFGPEPIKARLSLSRAAVLVTTPALYAKVEPLREELPDLRHVLLVGDGFEAALGRARALPVVATWPEEPALLHFTSGTTGRPKGALHVHEAIIAHHATARLALGLRPGDIYWCTADPGWVTGTSYGILGPLSVGATCILDEGDFDALRWCRVLAEEAVNIWYTAPTAIRLLMKAGTEVTRRFSYP